MRRWGILVVGGLLLLMSTVGIRREVYQGKDGQQITLQVNEAVEDKDIEWEQLMSELNELPQTDWQIQRDGRYNNMYGIQSTDSITFYNVQDTIASKALKRASEIVEVDLNQLIKEESSSLGEYESKQMILGDYGIVLDKRDAMSLTISPSLKIGDKEQEKWLKKIAGEELLIYSKAVNEEHKLYELGTPAYVNYTNYNYIGDNLPLIRYQVFMDKEDHVTKIRAVIVRKLGKNQMGPITEEVLSSLECIGETLGSKQEAEGLVHQTLEAVSGSTESYKGRVGSGQYTIKVMKDQTYEEMIEVLITF